MKITSSWLDDDTYIVPPRRVMMHKVSDQVCIAIAQVCKANIHKRGGKDLAKLLLRRCVQKYCQWCRYALVRPFMYPQTWNLQTYVLRGDDVYHTCWKLK